MMELDAFDGKAAVIKDGLDIVQKQLSSRSECNFPPPHPQRPGRDYPSAGRSPVVGCFPGKYLLKSEGVCTFQRRRI
jgi:hypothetical protein